MEVGGIQALRRWRARQSGRVGLVPTMGALHSGHQALMTRARAESDLVVTSIFVNPLQFGADEDFVQYPRPIASDLAKCEEAGVDFVFAPALGEMYPSAPEVRVVAGRMGAVFEGEARPGHFDGVLTVVAKLFNLIKPDVTVFGLKDIQQFCLVKRMIADLDFDIEIIGLPVVRDADGLAMSSRNEYLSPTDRERALAIPRALDAAAEVAAGGVREGAASGGAASGEAREGAASGEAVVESVADGVLPEAIESAARAVLESAAERGELDIIYLSLVDASTLRPCPADLRGSALLLVSATVGGTHLIDNLPLEF
jgi:pantoate--beta-alanine ligase